MLTLDDTTTPSTALPPRDAPALPCAGGSLARAARHAILRRLAPPLRHDMVVHLQSVGLLAETLSARLDRGVLAPHELQPALSKLNRLSREAVANCLQVAGWMAGPEDDTIGLRDAVQECARLLATSLDFRGLALRAEPGEGRIDVARPAARFLLAAAVLTLADGATECGEIVIHTEVTHAHGVARVAYAARSDPTFGDLHALADAPLDWDEMQALAAAHGAQLLRDGQAVVLRLPRADVTTPLAMVPV